MKSEQDQKSQDNRLGAEELAALMVDALLRADIVKQEQVERAMRIAIEEIDVRKVLGDC